MGSGFRIGVAIVEGSWRNKYGYTCAKRPSGVTNEGCIDVKACARTDNEEKESTRMCVPDFPTEKPTDLLYTANADVSSIRLVLAEAAQRPHWGVRCMDVATAFLHVPMPATAEAREHTLNPQPYKSNLDWLVQIRFGG